MPSSLILLFSSAFIMLLLLKVATGRSTVDVQVNKSLADYTTIVVEYDAYISIDSEIRHT